MDSQDTVAVLRGVGDILNLIRAAETDVRRIPEINHELHIAGLKRIESWFSNFALRETQDQIVKRIDPAVIASLRHTPDQLRVVSREKPIANDTLAELHRELDQLIEEVASGGLPDDLRNPVISNLEFAREAVLKYRIWGADGLQRAFELNVGSIVVRHSDTRNGVQGVLKGIAGFLTHLRAVLTTANAAYQLSKPAADAFALLAGVDSSGGQP